MRLVEIDFLRGIAVILVILNHGHGAFAFKRIGWVGVDLFFVLSGFLVSGLLFKEYSKFGSIRVSTFLIRRGFKIYPLFYFTILVVIIFEYLLKGSIPAYYKIISELFFLQNYIKGLLLITWSLAVEEHFYFLLVFVIYLLVRYGWINHRRLLVIIVLIVSFGCLLFRFYTHLNLPYRDLTHHFPTHLRIDSLLCGVIIAYFYYFNPEKLKKVTANRVYIIIAILFVSTPFLFERQSFFMSTIGYNLLYVGFGLVLIGFLLEADIAKKLTRVFSKSGIFIVSKVGYYSYGIYLWHMVVMMYLINPLVDNLFLQEGSLVEFVVYLFGSLLTGIVFSILVEQKFLLLRNKYFPGR